MTFLLKIRILLFYLRHYVHILSFNISFVNHFKYNYTNYIIYNVYVWHCNQFYRLGSQIHYRPKICIKIKKVANSHFTRTIGPYFPASRGHIKLPVLETGRAYRGSALLLISIADLLLHKGNCISKVGLCFFPVLAFEKLRVCGDKVIQTWYCLCECNILMPWSDYLSTADIFFLEEGCQNRIYSD